MTDKSEPVFENAEAEEMLRKAIGLFEEQKDEQAETVFNLVTEKFPGYFHGWAVYGDFLLARDQAQKALAPLRRAVALGFSAGIGHYLLGVAYLKVGRFHLAEQSLELAARFLEEKGDVLAHLGRAKLMLGRPAEARKLIEKAVQDDPTNPYIQTDLVQTYIVERNFDKALELAETALKLEPANEFLVQNKKIIEAMGDDFRKLSPEEQERRRQEALSEKYNTEMRLAILFDNLERHRELSADDLSELTEELRRSGLAGQITTLTNPNDPQGRAATEYIEMHKDIPEVEREITDAEYKEFEQVLFTKSSLNKKKRALLRLAHQGTEPALEILERYHRQPDESLTTWAKMALEECQMWQENKASSQPIVKFHKLDPEKR